MKKIYFLFGIIFLFNFISASASSSNFSVDAISEGISGGIFNSTDFTGSSVSQSNLPIYSASISICGDGNCESGEDCSSCVSDCGCSSDYTCSSGSCIAVSPPSSAPQSGPSGGGTTASILSESFSLSSEQINAKVIQGHTVSQQITITNKENKNLTVDITISRISNFLNTKESHIILKAGESKNLIFQIYANENTTPDLYLGQINFKSGNSEKTILTAVEVESANPLFDISIKIPAMYSSVLPGRELYSTVELYNMGESRRAVDVNLEYEIKNINEEIILHQTETIAVNTKISFMKEFDIPSDLKIGKYILYVKADYSNQTASASSWFNVGNQTSIPLLLSLIGIFIFIIISAIIFFWNRRKIKKEKPRYKVDETALIGAGLIKIK